MIIVVENGQTLMDLAIQYYGNASAIFDLANDNGLAVTDELHPGTALVVRDEKPDTAIGIFADYLNENNTVVVSKQSENTVMVLSTNDDEVLSDNDDNGLANA